MAATESHGLHHDAHWLILQFRPLPADIAASVDLDSLTETWLGFGVPGQRIGLNIALPGQQGTVPLRDVKITRKNIQLMTSTSVPILELQLFVHTRNPRITGSARLPAGTTLAIRSRWDSTSVNGSTSWSLLVGSDG